MRYQDHQEERMNKMGERTPKKTPHEFSPTDKQATQDPRIVPYHQHDGMDSQFNVHI